MSIQQNFPRPPPDMYKWVQAAKRLNRSSETMCWMYDLHDKEADAVWPAALEKLNRWVAKYVVHYPRLMQGRTDTTVEDELARRFILEIVDNKELEDLQLPDMAKASQDDIKSLTSIFEAWRSQAINDADFDSRLNTRFLDFLIIDEPSLRSLASLPDETIPLGPVTRQERRAQAKFYEDAYVWLIDSQAVGRYQGINDVYNYNGLMKLELINIPDAWFERVPRFDDECHIFERGKAPDGSGDLWYRPR
ncbi:hypothetical protein TruAng_002597 [Truncatella angustata]|nr:hypothetical protein TruAng_002597 [Truncatella angustata]